MKTFLNDNEIVKLYSNDNEVHGTVEEFVQNHQLLESIKEYVSSGFCKDKTIINLIETTNADYEISEKKPIKYILFDLGGVLYHGCLKNFCMWCFYKYGFTPQFPKSKVSVDHRMDTGKITIYDYLKEQNPELPEEDKDKLLLKWANVFSRHEKMFEIISSIDKELCKVGALSNLDRFNGEYFKAKGHFKDFDRLFFSYEMEMVKPNNKIFLKIIKDLELDPREILFIDDQPDNIEAAKKFSFNTILFNRDIASDLDSFMSILHSHGVEFI